MKNQFRLYRRPKGGFFYAHDSVTGKQDSLGTRDRAEAVTLLNARNESVRQPQLNLQIAKAYLAGTDWPSHRERGKTPWMPSSTRRAVRPGIAGAAPRRRLPWT